MNKSKELYSFDEVKDIMGCTSQHLFSLVAPPAVEKHTINNRIFFSKGTVRKLLLRCEK